MSQYKVERLIEMLTIGNQRLRRTAAEMLGRTGDVRAIKPLIKSLVYGGCSSADDALINFGEAAVEPLIAALSDKDKIVRRYVASSTSLITLCRSRALEPLTRLLSDKDASVRESAFKALRKLGGIRDVEYIIRVLKEDVALRHCAAFALGEIGDLRAVEPLISILQDFRWGVRANAVATLGKLGDSRAIEPLRQALIRVLYDILRQMLNPQENDRLTRYRQCQLSAQERMQRECRRAYYRDWDRRLRRSIGLREGE